MAYKDIESQRIIGVKANLYNFRYKGKNYLYTDHEESITSNNLVYQPAEYIVRDSIKASNDKARAELNIDFPINNELCLQFINTDASDVVSLVLKECHVESPEDAVNIFYGDMVGNNTNSNITTLTFTPQSVLIETKATRYTYQSQCNHFLYKSGCEVNKENFTFQVQVMAIDDTGTIITLSQIRPTGYVPPANTSEYLLAGMLESNEGEYKTIKQVIVATNTVVISAPCLNLRVGQLIYVSAGCSRNSNDCKFKFNNFPNYFGFEFVPNRNPYDAL